MLRRILSLPLHVQIFIGLALAVVAGLLTGQAGPFPGALSGLYDFLGKLFLNALKMLIVPLIASAIISGVAGIGSQKDFGRLGVKTLGYYLTTSLLAILLGVLLVNLFKPGITDGEPARELMGLTAGADAVKAQVSGRGMSDIVDIFIRMVPANVVAAAVQGDMLPLIFFALLFGYFMSRVPEKFRDSLTTFWQAVFEVMMRITDLIMRFAPLGVFGLVAGVVANTGLDAWRPLAMFFVTVVVGLALHMFLTLPLLVLFIGRADPSRHFRAMAPALLTAFSTSSSSATLPVTMDCVEKRAGVSNKTSSFVLPLGATVNMDGTALYECVAAMFIAQAYGLELTFTTQVVIVLLALLTSIGVAGIPSASLVAIVIILEAVGLPAEGIGLILAVDRVLDMCRTSVNVFSDSCGAVIIARSEGETGVLAS